MLEEIMEFLAITAVILVIILLMIYIISTQPVKGSAITLYYSLNTNERN